MKQEQIKQLKNLIDQTVTWTSSAQGCEKKKTGKVIDYIPPSYDAYDLLPYGADLSSLKFQRESSVPRLLVEVPRFHKKTGKELPSFYYAPLASRFLK